jgi:hypothetical protein
MYYIVNASRNFANYVHFCAVNIYYSEYNIEISYPVSDNMMSPVQVYIGNWPNTADEVTINSNNALFVYFI